MINVSSLILITESREITYKSKIGHELPGGEIFRAEHGYTAILVHVHQLHVGHPGPVEQIWSKLGGIHGVYGKERALDARPIVQGHQHHDRTQDQAQNGHNHQQRDQNPPPVALAWR